MWPEGFASSTSRAEPSATAASARRCSVLLSICPEPSLACQADNELRAVLDHVLKDLSRCSHAAMGCNSQLAFLGAAGCAQDARG